MSSDATEPLHMQTPTPTPTRPHPQAPAPGVAVGGGVLSVFDHRPFFEKALAYGVHNRIIDAARLAVIHADAPKGMVQIARYFGSEYLRPDLEKARERMVNLVSLYLEHTSGGDVRLAAESLRDHSFLSRSKGGSDLLKSLIAMPQSTHFGMNERKGFTDEHIPVLAKWSLKSLADYRIELAQRSRVAGVIQAALWMGDSMGLDADALEEAGKDAEAVIRTAVLMLAARCNDTPDWVQFNKAVMALRKKPPSTLALPGHVPPELVAAIEPVRLSVMADLPRILDAAVPTRRLFDQTPAFMGRYFWMEDGLAEVDDFDRAASAAWNKATGGHHDDSALLTLFLTLATGTTGKTLLTEKGAATLIRKIRKTAGVKASVKTGTRSGPTAHAGADANVTPKPGFDAGRTRQFIVANAPEMYRADYLALWDTFLDESLSLLASDLDYELTDALALLRRECNIKA
jgi:hypothetical protein